MQKENRRAYRVYLISDALPFGRLWYDTPGNAIGYAMHSSRSHDAVIRAYDAGGNVIETHEYAGEAVRPSPNFCRCRAALASGQRSQTVPIGTP